MGVHDEPQTQRPRQAATPAPATASDLSHEATSQKELLQPFYFQPNLRPRREAMYRKRLHLAKLALRFLDIAFSTTTLVVALVLVSMDHSAKVWFLIFAVPGPGCAVIWEVLELFTLWRRGGKVGIHPGAHVGVHLILWLLLAIGVGFLTPVLRYDTEAEGFNSHYWENESWRKYGYDPLESVWVNVIVFLALATLCNFALFVFACVEMARMKRQPPAVYVLEPDGKVVPMMGVIPVLELPKTAHLYEGAPLSVTPRVAEPKSRA